MGAILNIKFMTMKEKDIKKELESIIDNAFRTRTSEEDMYRGDFGNSRIGLEPVFIDYTSSRNKIQKNSEKFEDETDFEKYRMDYAILGEVGYIASSHPKVALDESPRLKKGEFIIVNDIIEQTWNPHKRKFKSITELKNYLKCNPAQTSLSGQGIYIIDKNLETRVIGHIYCDKREYKQQPKQLPKKYATIHRYVVVGFGGFCPY